MKKEKKGTFGQERFELAKKHHVDLANVQNIQQLLKEGFKDLLAGAMQAEFDGHMGYDKCTRNNSSNARNGNGNKVVQSNFGQFQIESSRDREDSFESKIWPPRTKDLADCEEKIINCYAAGTSTRDITKTIEDIYGFALDPTHISKITDKILPSIAEWKSRPLKKIAPFVLLDGMRFNVREDGMGKEISC